MNKWIRLGISGAVAGVLALIAVIAKIPVMFWLAPGILGVVHVVLWDVLKTEAFDKGFFRFLKLGAFVAAYILLLLAVMDESLGMINNELFSIKNTYSDLKICSITGAIGMVTFTFLAGMACMESFGNRNFGPAVSVVGVIMGLLVGLVSYFGGAIAAGVSKTLAIAPIVITGFCGFNYIKENGLVYNDLPLDAGFSGFGKKGGSKFKKTGRPIDDAMNSIAWSESRFHHLYHNYNMNVEVSASIYSSSVDFTINARVYDNSSGLTQGQANEVNQQINNILKSKQNKISSRAKKSIDSITQKNPELAPNGFDISVKIGYVDVK